MTSFYTVSLAVTKLDILDTFDELKIAVSYKLAGKVLPSFPGQLAPGASIISFGVTLFVAADQRVLQDIDVEYVTLPGWKQSTEQCRRFEELPANAQAYIKKIEDYIGVQGW